MIKKFPIFNSQFPMNPVKKSANMPISPVNKKIKKAAIVMRVLANFLTG